MFVQSNQQNPLTPMMKVETDVLDSLGVGLNTQGTINNINVFASTSHHHHLSEASTSSYNNNEVPNCWENRENIAPYPDSFVTQPFLKTILEKHLQQTYDQHDEIKYRIDHLCENDVEVSLVSSS